jgi:hypothetical protein
MSNWRFINKDSATTTLLGLEVAQSTVAKYMAKKGDPSGQSWNTFLRNHAPHVAAMDLFVVPTICFKPLYVSSGWLAASLSGST